MPMIYGRKDDLLDGGMEAEEAAKVYCFRAKALIWL